MVALTAGCTRNEEPATESAFAQTKSALAQNRTTLALSADYHADPGVTFLSYAVGKVASGINCNGFLFGPNLFMTSATCANVPEIFVEFRARAPGTRGVYDTDTRSWKGRTVDAEAYYAEVRCRALLTHQLIPADLSRPFFRHGPEYNSDSKIFYCDDVYLDQSTMMPPGVVFGYLDFDLRDPAQDRVGSGAYYTEIGMELLGGSDAMFTLGGSGFIMTFPTLSLTFTDPQGTQLNIPAYRQIDNRLPFPANSFRLAGAPFIDNDTDRVRMMRGRGLSRFVNGEAIYYDTMFEIFELGELVGRTGASPSNTRYSPYESQLIGNLGLNLSDYFNKLDADSPMDPNDRDWVLDIQKDLEATAGEANRPHYFIDFASERQNVLWTITASGRKRAQLFVKDPPSPPGPMRGRFYYLGAPRVGSPNPAVSVLRHDRLNLKPRTLYRIDFELKRGADPVEITANLGDQSATVGYPAGAFVTHRSMLLESGNMPTFELSVKGGPLEIYSITLSEALEDITFNTADERQLWRRKDGHRGVVVPVLTASGGPTPAVPEWALQI
ncbi:MAG: hypothetical protein AAF449_12250, partial [Myxococcota bacterium]